MPNKQKHRGNHPQDIGLFTPEWIEKLREAVQHYAWLQSHGYAQNSSLKLVGDRFQLRERQRKVLMRATCTYESLALRKSLECQPVALAGMPLWLDGFNILIAVESALSGGFLFRGMDGCLRDNASIHGTYKRVEETHSAIEMIGKLLAKWNLQKVVWLLDAPISNSGKLRGKMYEIAKEHGWEWEVELVNNPDRELIASGSCVASTDGLILDNAAGWINFNAHFLNAMEVKAAQTFDLA